MVKGEREQNESLNTVAVKTALEEKHYPYHVIHQGRVREIKMTDELLRPLRGILYAYCI